MHIRNSEVRTGSEERMESTRNRPKLDIAPEAADHLKLNAAELFETFLGTHYVGAKRFSLEGGETLIPLLDALIERSAAKHGVKEMVLGMPHRGRLNVLANTLDKPYGMIFGEFEDNHPESYAGDGDVKYHLGFSHDHVTADGQTIHLSLTPNPSHLEAVNPVVEGRMRAKQRRFKDSRPQARRARPDPRRRRVRRPGAGGRDPEPVAAARLSGPAARSTSSSTTRSASRPRRSTAGRPATAPTSPR